MSHFVAGFGSGIASALILQPLDLLKTRVQQQDGPSFARSWIRDMTATKITPNAPCPIAGVTLGLWRGVLPSVLRTGSGCAIYFSALDFLRRRDSLVHDWDPARSKKETTMTGARDLASGAVARIFAGFVTMPLTVLKVRYESSLYRYPSLALAIKFVYSQGGVAAFFAGFGATAIRDAPYAGLYVFFYELSRRQLENGLETIHSHGSDSKGNTTHASSIAPSTMINFASGILSGATCSVISNPFDAVKTRIQLQPQQYRNFFVAFHLMVKQEGIRALFAGVGLRMCRKALSSALAWTLYEELVRCSNLI